MLTIFISLRRQAVISADGSRARVCRAYVRRNKKLGLLQDCSEFGDPSYVRFVLRGWRRFIRLQRNSKLEQAIVRFLERYHAKQDMRFDCYAFANDVHGVQQHCVTFMFDHWSVGPFHAPDSGDVIFLTSPKEGKYAKFHHAAVYLGEGLYISVWGAGGDLEIATLKDMKKAFKAKEVFLAKPKAVM